MQCLIFLKNYASVGLYNAKIFMTCNVQEVDSSQLLKYSYLFTSVN